MRRLALLVAVLTLPSTAGAAELVVVPSQFSPAEEWLRVQAQLPKPARVGVQLATLGGKPVGWIAPPHRRQYLNIRWNGRLAGARVPDGRYRIKLLQAKRELASSPLKIDRTAPRIAGFEARDESRTPFAGDNALLTTISPNNDGLRDSAKIRFTLSEPARVSFEVTRTISAPETVYELKATLPRGRNTFTWFPPKTIGARTYLVRIHAIDGAGNRSTYGAATARAGRRASAPVVRVLGVDAGFTRESYVAGQQARLAVETDARSLTMQTFRAGQEDVATHSDTIMNGVAVTEPVAMPWPVRNGRATLSVGIGPWPSGLYFVKLVADDGRIGYAPFVVRPTILGATSRVAMVMPTNTWQAYNFRDADGNGWGDTWYAKGAQSTVELGRPYLRRGVPPQWRKYDANFLRWLNWTGKQPEMLSETDLESIRTAEELLRLYDFVIFPGHTEYVTRHEYDLIRNYRDLGGNLAFLSANNFFWGVKREGRVLRRTRLWREAGLPESALLGVQYRANDDGRIQKPFVVRSASTAPWFWAGTGLNDGSVFGETVGGYGIEIDATTPASPIGTIVLAEVPDLYGPGLTAQMTYYETAAGAKVFSGGTIDFGGSATLWPVRRMLENLWARLASP